MNLYLKPNRPTAQRLTAQAALIFIAFLLWVLPVPAWAGPGHDHGDDAPSGAVGTASPRVSSHSDLFELVAVVQGSEMKIYLDRYATNEPVTNAQIEVEVGTAKGAAQAQADGSYLFTNELLAKPGTLPASFTVLAGKDSDLLAGDLTIADPHADHADAPAARPWLRWLGFALGATLLLAAAAWAWRKGRKPSEITMKSIAALAVFIWATSTFDAQAGPGHDHGDESAPAASGNAPKRQADGSVFLPKNSQRQLAVRTVVAQEASLPTTVELTGRVVADPNASGKVQPTQAGRIEAGPNGLPQLGQAVRKGQVLAVVRTATAPIERANQQAQSLELRASLDLAKKRLARLEQLEGTVPAKDIEAARSEVASLQQRGTAVAGGVASVEQLIAPVSGVIAATTVVAGQVVDAREVVFEILDPSRLGVEASAFNTALLGNIASASATTASGAGQGTSVALQFAGAGRVLREGAISLLFRAVTSGSAVPLVVGQTVKVIVQTKSQIKGFAVPTAAVVKNPSNQDMVWVHTGAEQFAPRTVRALPLDGATVSVVDGLKAGDRVVTQGAPLVNQVR